MTQLADHHYKYVEWHPRSFLNILKCAEVTTELRECLAAFDPSHVSDVEHRGVYVSAIQNKVGINILHKWHY